jgi:hypothetical protein
MVFGMVALVADFKHDRIGERSATGRAVQCRAGCLNDIVTLSSLALKTLEGA